MFRLCAFDLDGTLVNTIHDIADAVNFALRALGQPSHTETEIQGMVGNGMRNLCEKALPPGCGVQPEELETAYGAQYLAHCCERSAPYPGIGELLRALQQSGVQLAVVTNKPHGQAARVMEHYFPAIRFAQIVGQSDRFPKKPAPDALRWVMEQCGADTENTLYVGDSDVDVRLAHNADVRCAGVSWGFRGRAHLEAAGADFVCDTADALRALLLAQAPHISSAAL